MPKEQQKQNWETILRKLKSKETMLQRKLEKRLVRKAPRGGA
jgi:hypothetical protein